MSLFRKKPQAQQPSSFDLIPLDVQDKLIEDVILIARTVKEWPNLVPVALHGPIGNEVSGVLRKTGLKLVGIFMGGDDTADNVAKAFEGVHVPALMTKAFHAIKLALTPPPIEDDPNGKAA